MPRTQVFGNRLNQKHRFFGAIKEFRITKAASSVNGRLLVQDCSKMSKEGVCGRKEKSETCVLHSAEAARWSWLKVWKECLRQDGVWISASGWQGFSVWSHGGMSMEERECEGLASGWTSFITLSSSILNSARESIRLQMGHSHTFPTRLQCVMQENTQQIAMCSTLDGWTLKKYTVKIRPG